MQQINLMSFFFHYYRFIKSYFGENDQVTSEALRLENDALKRKIQELEEKIHSLTKVL